MAGKKPAKRNITNVKEVKKELLGKAVLYYGVPERPFVCPSCKKTLIKGIIYEDSNASYCSRVCIPIKETV
jgi:hypothetical protein